MYAKPKINVSAEVPSEDGDSFFEEFLKDPFSDDFAIVDAWFPEPGDSDTEGGEKLQNESQKDKTERTGNSGRNINAERQESSGPQSKDKGNGKGNLQKPGGTPGESRSNSDKSQERSSARQDRKNSDSDGSHSFSSDRGRQRDSRPTGTENNIRPVTDRSTSGKQREDSARENLARTNARIENSNRPDIDRSTSGKQREESTRGSKEDTEKQYKEYRSQDARGNPTRTYTRIEYSNRSDANKSTSGKQREDSARGSKEVTERQSKEYRSQDARGNPARTITRIEYSNRSARDRSTSGKQREDSSRGSKEDTERQSKEYRSEDARGNPTRTYTRIEYSNRSARDRSTSGKEKDLVKTEDFARGSKEDTDRQSNEHRRQDARGSPAGTNTRTENSSRSARDRSISGKENQDSARGSKDNAESQSREHQSQVARPSPAGTNTRTENSNRSGTDRRTSEKERDDLVEKEDSARGSNENQSREHQSQDARESLAKTDMDYSKDKIPGDRDHAESQTRKISVEKEKQSSELKSSSVMVRKVVEVPGSTFLLDSSKLDTCIKQFDLVPPGTEDEFIVPSQDSMLEAISDDETFDKQILEADDTEGRDRSADKVSTSVRHTSLASQIRAASGDQSTTESQLQFEEISDDETFEDEITEKAHDTNETLDEITEAAHDTNETLGDKITEEVHDTNETLGDKITEKTRDTNETLDDEITEEGDRSATQDNKGKMLRSPSEEKNESLLAEEYDERKERSKALEEPCSNEKGREGENRSRSSSKEKSHLCQKRMVIQNNSEMKESKSRERLPDSQERQSCSGSQSEEKVLSRNDRQSESSSQNKEKPPFRKDGHSRSSSQDREKNLSRSNRPFTSQRDRRSCSQNSEDRSLRNKSRDKSVNDDLDRSKRLEEYRSRTDSTYDIRRTSPVRRRRSRSRGRSIERYYRKNEFRRSVSRERWRRSPSWGISKRQRTNLSPFSGRTRRLSHSPPIYERPRLRSLSRSLSKERIREYAKRFLRRAISPTSSDLSLSSSGDSLSPFNDMHFRKRRKRSRSPFWKEIERKFAENLRRTLPDRAPHFGAADSVLTPYLEGYTQPAVGMYPPPHMAPYPVETEPPPFPPQPAYPPASEQVLPFPNQAPGPPQYMSDRPPPPYEQHVTPGNQPFMLPVHEPPPMNMPPAALNLPPPDVPPFQPPVPPFGPPSVFNPQAIPPHAGPPPEHVAPQSFSLPPPSIHAASPPFPFPPPSGPFPPQSGPFPRQSGPFPPQSGPFPPQSACMEAPWNSSNNRDGIGKVTRAEVDMAEPPPPPKISHLIGEKKPSLTSLLEASAKVPDSELKQMSVDEGLSKDRRRKGKSGNKVPVDPVLLVRCQEALRTLKADDGLIFASAGHFVHEELSETISAAIGASRQVVSEFQSPVLRDYQLSFSSSLLNYSAWMASIMQPAPQVKDPVTKRSYGISKPDQTTDPSVKRDMPTSSRQEKSRSRRVSRFDSNWPIDHAVDRRGKDYSSEPFCRECCNRKDRIMIWNSTQTPRTEMYSKGVQVDLTDTVRPKFWEALSENKDSRLEDKDVKIGLKKLAVEDDIVSKNNEDRNKNTLSETPNRNTSTLLPSTRVRSADGSTHPVSVDEVLRAPYSSVLSSSGKGSPAPLILPPPPKGILKKPRTSQQETRQEADSCQQQTLDSEHPPSQTAEPDSSPPKKKRVRKRLQRQQEEEEDDDDDEPADPSPDVKPFSVSGLLKQMGDT